MSDTTPDPALSKWLSAGYEVFRATLPRHYGSLETVMAGGDKQMAEGNPAAALYFYEKCVDMLDSIYVSVPSPSRTPSAADLVPIDRYFTTAELIRDTKPGIYLETTYTEVGQLLSRLARDFRSRGWNDAPFEERMARLRNL